MQARWSTLVSRPQADVFAFLAEPANDRLWRSHLTASHGRIAAVGDRVSQTYSASGQSKTVELEVTEFVPPERLSFRVAGPVSARLSFRCRPEGDGTRVSMSLAAELKGIVALASGRAEAEAAKVVQADLSALKRILESGG